MRKQLKITIFSVFVVVTLAGQVPVSASSANISHSYKTAASIVSGSLLSLDSNRSNYVALANTTNEKQLIGVATKSNESLIAADTSSTAVQVATSGVVNALVSTLNGSIKTGDQIAVSPFNGVGAKAEPGSYIIGLAQGSFGNASKGAIKEKVKDKQGKYHQIFVGFVPISIGVGIAAGSPSNNSSSINGLQKFAKSITGYKVSTIRVVISLVVALLTLIALVTLTYASIYGAIISIGRNPLAKYSIFRTLARTLAVAIIMASVSSLIIVLLLS